MAMSRAVRQAMEMVDLIETGDRGRSRPEPRQRGLKSAMTRFKDGMSSKMIALNIVRLVCITLEFTCPAFSTAWLIFRLSGCFVAD